MLGSNYISLCLTKGDFDNEENWTQLKISSFESSFDIGFLCCPENLARG